MAEKTARIIVAGDVSIDLLSASVAPKDAIMRGNKMPPNWRLYPGTRTIRALGGALLTARYVELVAGRDVVKQQVDNMETASSEDMVHSIAELGLFPRTNDETHKKDMVYRVKQFGGFDGPESPDKLRMLNIPNDDADADVVVLDDAGNGFRYADKMWPLAIKTPGMEPIVILKKCRPLAMGDLWNKLQEAHADRLMVVASADDLRAEGANISRGLSWERTATDFVWQMAHNPKLRTLGNCAHLIVRFGAEGAIHYTTINHKPEAYLYFDPTVIEGGYGASVPGKTLGANSAFCGMLAARIGERLADPNAKNRFDAVGEGIRDGIVLSKRLFLAGFGSKGETPAYPDLNALEKHSKDDPKIASVCIPPADGSDSPDPDFWCIIKDVGGANVENLADDIVRKGGKSALEGVPVGRFGKLDTIDRSEIEAYRSIQNLMREFLATTNSNRPLSIAVFGPPGSGKSFGVEQVAKSVAPGKVKTLNFNLSQFDSIQDLAGAFHKVRDLALEGKVPLVFFDEFDASFKEELGWLKYFLAPMQDGAFKDGETMHPLGKAIFVFAGGTKSTFREFAREDGDDAPSANPADNNKIADNAQFVKAKGPDFVSRLRGYVNVMGPNPLEKDNLAIVRRAMLLRVFIQQKAQQVVDSEGQIRIDPNVLNALLNVRKYKHGVRSLQSVLDMSMLSGRRIYEKATLPPVKQLKLHVTDDFAEKLIAEVPFGIMKEEIGKAIHERYRETWGNMLPWEELTPEERKANYNPAVHIPVKLEKIGWWYKRTGESEIENPAIPAEHIEELAEMEHARWFTERRMSGWVLGPKDNERKLRPSVLDWAVLPEDEREKDRDTVRNIPQFMADAGYRIFPVEREQT